MNTPHARATRARADQFNDLLQAGWNPRIAAKPDNLRLNLAISIALNIKPVLGLQTPAG